MAESHRDPLTTGADPDRDGRVEALLVEGLDRYFGGRYEEAIHIWTRVLFLDRTHSRAKAYIDRARTALAEAQRRSDELLHASQAMLDRGRMADARALLSQAIVTSGDDERAAALRMKLDRMERVGWSVADVDRVSAMLSPVDRLVGSPYVWWGLVVSTAVAMVWLIGRLVIPAFQPADPAAPPALVAPAAVTAITSSDAALVRARTLYGRGRLAEALRALDRVDLESDLRPEADRLRVEIQRLLLAAEPPRVTPPGAPGREH